MNILGLHFGHDAGVSVLKDGKIAVCILRERHRRIKHAISLEVKTIQTAIDAAGLRFDQIDYCAITSTQRIELIIDDPQRFSLTLAAHPNHAAPCTLTQLNGNKELNPASLGGNLLKFLYDPAMRYLDETCNYALCYPEHRDLRPEQIARFGWMDIYVRSSLWPGATLDQIAASDFSAHLKDDSVRHGFHYPVTVNLDGHSIAGYFIAHHAAHAASTYYQSGFNDAAILTHDGYADGSELTGMFYLGAEHKIYPLTPHHLIIGGCYEEVGSWLGLGNIGAPGKLMGLAGYGNPRFFDQAWVGNAYDWKTHARSRSRWTDYCLTAARAMNYDLTPLADRNRMTAPINVDLAASTQKLFEETILAAGHALYKVISRAGRKTNNLCLSGGTALNCPANTRLFREGQFPELFIEPGCNDSGLAIGAAMFLYHNVLDQPRHAPREPRGACSYLGVEVGADSILQAIQTAGNDIVVTSCPDAAEAAAQDIANDRIIGWFEGRSEIGPRALGHRSILADARKADAWPRVNRLKGREFWRPFAPAVLESEKEKWFHGGPNPSPYMLFTSAVRSRDLPAITHHDCTARIQTVTPANGEFFRVVELFFAKTGVPAVLNTSFNGPGEPIIETPSEAIQFLISTELDALYMGGFRIVRKAASFAA
ncbi:MAG TPA: carbamoyltransferase C-terminal domain-containing protein, partial [Humisphaera sp.]|nr:carbamoyltransferase C-terminal domain-containing protein [Humisphaera sp.]